MSTFNLTGHVLARAETLSAKTALQIVGGDTSERWSYAALRAAVLGTATGLLRMGLAPGARILLRLDNTVDFPILHLAAMAVDMVPVPTSAQLTVPEITRIAQALSPDLIAAGPGIALPEGDAPLIGLEALRALRENAPADPVMGDPERPGYIVFTSGTSGAARGVVHAHRAILARRAMIAGWTGLCAADRLLHAGALNWTYTLGTGLMDPWSVGASALIPAPGVRAADLPALLAEHRATVFAAATGVFRQMLRVGVTPLADLRHGLSAGEKLPDATRRAWEAATGTPILEAFGLSECSTFISAGPARPARAGTLGRAQPGRRVAILGPDGPAGENEPGQISVAADDPGLMLGYLDAPDETAARHRDGWFLTGDVGAMDAEGYITYLGRDDDMMNAGGYRVSPLEIEAALATCPGVAEAAAVELPVKADASVIAAFYVASQDLDEITLNRHCAARLARYKCPRLFVRRETLPRGANGKLRRRALRESWKETPC